MQHDQPIWKHGVHWLHMPQRKHGCWLFYDKGVMVWVGIVRWPKKKLENEFDCFVRVIFRNHRSLIFKKKKRKKKYWPHKNLFRITWCSVKYEVLGSFYIGHCYASWEIRSKVDSSEYRCEMHLVHSYHVRRWSGMQTMSFYSLSPWMSLQNWVGAKMSFCYYCLPFHGIWDQAFVAQAVLFFVCILLYFRSFSILLN